MKIGSLEVKNNLFLAPMAGVTDSPFRDECILQGAGMVYSEMVSAKGLSYRNQNTRQLLINKTDAPCAVQLFGSDPDVMAQQAASDELDGFALIDINMGCPARKITGNCEGSALMLRPHLAYRIMEQVASAAKVPVTVKIRAGYDDDHKNAVEIAQLAQKAGISAVTVHGRTKEQGYSGTADRSIIADVAKNVDIPVIGNGDIVDGASAADMLSRGCAGIMIGRAAQGNPWIFAEILAYLNDTPYRKPSWEEKKPIIMRHAQNLVALKRNIAMRQMRRHMCDYVRGMRGAAAFRANITSLNTLEDLRLLLDNLTD